MKLSSEKKKNLFVLVDFNLDNLDYPRFVYLSYSKTNEKWNVIHAIERLTLVLETHQFRTGIQTTNNNNSSRDNNS